MKINAIGKQNIYLSNYKVNTKQVTFGHYLDDENIIKNKGFQIYILRYQMLTLVYGMITMILIAKHHH